MARIPGQRLRPCDSRGRQQRAQQRARRQVVADEAGPRPAHRQRRRVRVPRQAAAEAVDEVLVPAVPRPRPEDKTLPRPAGPPPPPPPVSPGHPPPPPPPPAP